MKTKELDPYIIEGGSEGADRLSILASATWPASELFLRSAGLRPGMKVLDLGCGNGAMSNRIAATFGPFTMMLGLDADESVLKFARADALKENLAISYQVCNLENAMPEGEFDFIYVRLLLSHLRDPKSLLLKIKSVLKPGGIIAIEDVDFNGHFSYPPSQAFDQYAHLYLKLGEMRGVDPLIGPRLPSLLRSTGFESIKFNVASPTFDQGPGKLMALLTLKSIRNTAIEAGIIKEDALDQLIDDLEVFTKNPNSMMSLPRFFQVSATIKSKCGQ